jgi:signal transduction histidine kinase
MSRWWTHLRGKVLAFGAIMSVVPLALFGWYGLESARVAQVEIIQSQNRAAARTVAEQLSQSVYHGVLQLQLLARVDGGALPRAPVAEQERVLYTVLRDLPYLEEVALLDSSGQEQLRISRREVLAGMNHPSQAGTPMWHELQAGKPALGAVTLDVDGRPLFSLGVPLPDGSGALMARATLRDLMSDIPAVRGGGDVQIQVADESGRLIGASDFSYVLSGSRAVLPPEGDEPYTSVTGAEALGVTAPVPGVAWQVVGETPLAAGMLPVRHLAVEFAAAALVIMAVVIGLSVVFGLQLTVPVERLEAGARRVGAGELAYRIPEGGLDELGRLVSAFNQMTARLERQDAALRQERDQLDAVVSAIGAGLALIAPDGEVLWANRTLREWAPGEPIGRPCWEVLGRSDCEGCLVATTAGTAGEGSPGHTCPGPAEGLERQAVIGGRTRLLRHSTHQLAAPAPGEPARLEVLEDVTDRRAMEAMVRQSEKLAAVGQLASGVAHEINNPLAVISAYAEDLADRIKEEGATALAESGELDAYLNQLQVQVRRCKGITTNLLDFARRGPAEPEPVDAADVARRTAALVASRARKLGIAVTVEMAEGLAPVRATRDHLQQVFLNLVTNALDVLEEKGGGTVTLSGRQDGAQVELAVADDGPGMDEATLERAMEPFFTTKPIGRGTGLGLSTCYGIISGLGGSMSLQSSPGLGTRVRFTLPAWRSE